ncbi:MAG: site-specific integrase [Elusimicrobiota bacterium]|jgi:integrase
MTPYGDGRVFKRGSRWWIAYYAPVRGRIREVREAGGKTEQEARRTLAKRVREVLAHREGFRPYTGPDASRMTVKRIVEAYLVGAESRGLRSIRPLQSHAKVLILEIGHERITTITTETVSRYVAARKRAKAAVATINRELELLRASVRQAHADGWIAWTPAVRSLPARQENVRTGFLTRDEMARLFAAVVDPDLRDFLEFFGATAMRPAEIGSLRWTSWDQKAGVVRLEASGAKIGHSRVLPVVGTVKAVLARRKARKAFGCPFIFHNAGKAATRSNGGVSKGWYGEWSRALEAAKLPASLLIYDLRRSAIRVLRDAGVPERTIMSISGHRTRSTFDRYSIVTSADIADALRMVSGYPEDGQNTDDSQEKAR